MDNFRNDCCHPWAKNSFRTSVQAVQNRKSSGCADCTQVRSIDRIFFLQTKATHFKTMTTTVEEVNDDKRKVPDEFFFVVLCLLVLLPKSMSKLIEGQCKLTCKLSDKIIRLLTSLQTNNWIPVFMF